MMSFVMHYDTFIPLHLSKCNKHYDETVVRDSVMITDNSIYMFQLLKYLQIVDIVNFVM